MSQEIPVADYGIASISYYRRGIACYDRLTEQRKATWFFYASLEFRNCIERLLYEYLVVFGHEDWNTAWESDWRPKELRQRILDVEPEFDKKLEFASVLYAPVVGVGIYLLDLNRMSSLYGRLGNFLHAPKRPEKSSDDPNW